MKQKKPDNKLFGSAFQFLNQFHPFHENIHKEDTADTGSESIRLANQTIKTANRSIKTTVNTTKTAANAVKKSGQAIYKTTETAVKLAADVFKVTESVWAHLMAALLNPVIWIILLIAFMSVMLGALVIIIIDGGTANTQTAYISASGLGIVEEKYLEGLALFKAAETAKQNGFNAMIQSAYYGNPLSGCDLIYMEKTYPDTAGNAAKSYFQTGFATPEYKEIMEKAWNLGINEVEGTAVAYIYLQKQANAAKHTEMDIYDVKFIPEVFTKIMDLCALYTDSQTAYAECPYSDCDSKKDWYWDSWDEEWDYEWVDFCPHNHTLHCFGLAFYSKNDIMAALHFTNKEREWEELTEAYFMTLTEEVTS